MANSPTPGRPDHRNPSSWPSQAAKDDTQSPTQGTHGHGGSGSRPRLEPGGRPLPEYVLLQKLGEGGFGEVWKARGPGKVEVALKFIRLGDRAGEVELRALDLIKGIRHANLVGLSGTWQQDGQLIIAMDLADGTLHDRLNAVLKQGQPGIPLRELLEYMREAAKCLDHLNAINIQHQDVKPQNLLLVGGSVKVADFGLAKVLQHSVTTKSHGGLSVAYAPPEFHDRKTTRWSDQYSLAVSYCQLRGGRLPFEGTPVQVMIAHVRHEPDLSMLPAAERPAVARALAKEPKERWPSCGAFVEALRSPVARPEKSAALGRTLPPSLPSMRTINARRPERARDRWVLLAGLLLLLLSVGLTALLSRWGGADRGKADGSGVVALNKDRDTPPQKKEPLDGKDVQKKNGDPRPLEKKGRPDDKDMLPPPRPVLSLRPIADVTVEAGQSTSVEVRVDRDNCPGDIALEVVGLPVGVEMKPGRIPTEDTTARLEFTAGSEAAATTRTVTVKVGTAEARAERDILVTVKRPQVKPRVPKEALTLDLGGGVKLELVYVKEGEFQMGSTKEEIDTILREDKDAKREWYDPEQPRHRVEITKPFWLGKYAVTQEQYTRLTGKPNPSWFCATGSGKSKVQGMDTSRFPVENVSWDEATAFCDELNRKHLDQLPEVLRQAGYTFRLPTEAQWEYACRAGTETPFHFGKELNGTQANCDGNHPYGTPVQGPFLGRTCPVGSEPYQPNAFGLYDMHANVWQWCADYYDPKYYGNSPLKDPFNSPKGEPESPKGPFNGQKAEAKRHVVRGGSSFNRARYCRAAYRRWYAPGDRISLVGFRVALRLD
jgi:formylglycine-generating enzyme required for sulfatase activity/serine/threonine protein kinase